MNIVFICDPERYPHADNDIPVCYKAAARDPKIDLFHLPVAGVTGADQVEVVPVETGELSHDAFLNLNAAPRRVMPVTDVDVMFCRTLKPFPEGHLDRLGLWIGKTKFLNNPLNKKIQISAGFLSGLAPNFTPETIVTGEASELDAYLARHETVVAKRPNSTNGLGVYKVWRDGGAYWTDHVHEGVHEFPDARAMLDYVCGDWDAVELVRFLPRVTAGDKRVVVVDGEIYGAYIRRSASGHWVHNVSSSDSMCYPAEVSDFERQAVAETVPLYRDYGFYTLGYDFLMNDDGRWLISEINVGNIGGIARLEQLTGDSFMNRFLDWIVRFGERPACDTGALGLRKSGLG